jgi:anti-sigma factor RsiW
MTEHIPSALLAKFSAGDLEEPVAVAVARHIDSCAQCANNAAAEEPLSLAFASTVDPVVPEGLSERIVAAAAQQDFDEAKEKETGTSSIAIFLLAAAVLLAVIVSPMGVVDGTQSALVGVAHKSKAALGRGGSIGLAIGFSLGLVVAAVLIRRRRS